MRNGIALRGDKLNFRAILIILCKLMMELYKKKIIIIIIQFKILFLKSDIRAEDIFNINFINFRDIWRLFLEIV